MRKPPKIFLLESLPVLVTGLADPDKFEFHQSGVKPPCRELTVKQGICDVMKLSIRARRVQSGLQVFRQSHLPGVSPQPLEVVEVTGLLIEDVNDKVAVVH